MAESLPHQVTMEKVCFENNLQELYSQVANNCTGLYKTKEEDSNLDLFFSSLPSEIIFGSINK